MKNLKNALILSFAGIATVASILTAVYTCTLTARLEEVSRTSRADMNYLRNCIRLMESELTSSVIDRLADIGSPAPYPTEGSVAAPLESETTVDAFHDILPDKTADESETSPRADESIPSWDMSTPETETAEFPTHNTPEDGPDGACLYTITTHKGRIGVFDTEDRLIRTVNVFVLSLPEADRAALDMGIPVYSEEQLDEILERYE